jgi:hypothetical protein
MHVLDLLWNSDIKVSPNMHAVKLKHFLEESFIGKHSNSSSSNNNNNNNNDNNNSNVYYGIKQTAPIDCVAILPIHATIISCMFRPFLGRYQIQGMDISCV